jgi:hypothetical protein
MESKAKRLAATNVYPEVAPRKTESKHYSEQKPEDKKNGRKMGLTSAGPVHIINSQIAFSSTHERIANPVARIRAQLLPEQEC